MLALINQKASYVTGQGQVNPTLYKAGGHQRNNASAFHDKTSAATIIAQWVEPFAGSTTTGVLG